MPKGREINSEALQLPGSAMPTSAGALPMNHDMSLNAVGTAWDLEIASRINDIDSGRVKTVPWSEARRQIVGTDQPQK